jgi:hypothetical protein
MTEQERIDQVWEDLFQEYFYDDMDSEEYFRKTGLLTEYKLGMINLKQLNERM